MEFSNPSIFICKGKKNYNDKLEYDNSDSNNIVILIFFLMFLNIENLIIICYFIISIVNYYSIMEYMEIKFLFTIHENISCFLNLY